MAPEEAIFLTMLALLSAGDHVICTFPGYQSLYEVRLRHCVSRVCWQSVRLQNRFQCYADACMGMRTHQLLCDRAGSISSVQARISTSACCSASPP